MKDKIFCIYPMDKTTDFLEPIIKELSSYFDDIFSILRIEPSDESHSAAISLIEAAPNNSVFIFLGHGNSMAFKGADIDDYHKDIFIDNSRLNIFNGKSLFALSCRSSELLDVGLYTAETKINQSISFPNIISSWTELEYEREIKGELYSNLTKTQINIFNKLIVDATIYSLKVLKLDVDFIKVHRRFIHFINQKMVEFVINDPSVETRVLADLIFDFKKGITLDAGN